MKVCYFIQTHKNPEQIYRLVHILKKSSPDSLVILSHDFSACNLELNFLDELQGIKIIPSKGGRGSFSIIQAYLEAIEWLFNNNIDFDWFINMSGQDYPIKAISEIEDFLYTTSYDGFMEYFQVFSKDSHWSIHDGYSRHLYKYKILVNNLPEWQQKVLKPLQIINLIQPLFRINFSYGFRIGIKRKHPFSKDLICYGGSYFCTLSRRCIEYLHNFCHNNTELIDYYKDVLNPDESFIQTILINSNLFNLCNDCKYYFDFSRTHSSHPAILTINDYQSLVRSQAHFARKFDMNVDGKILDILERTYHRKILI